MKKERFGWAIGISTLLVIACGIGTIAQTVNDPDYEEFKRYEAFRKSKIDAAEKEKQDGAKAVYDDFLLYKEYRAMQQKEGAKPSEITPVVAPATVVPSATGSPQPVVPEVVPSPVTVSPALGRDIREAEFKEAYRRYRLLNTLETTSTPIVTAANRPLSVSWDWVTRLGHVVLDYQTAGPLDTFRGWEWGFGGRLVLPIGANTAISLGPELVFSGVTSTEKDKYGHDIQQQFTILRIPAQIQQRIGAVTIGFGGYVARALTFGQTRVTPFGLKLTESYPYILEGLNMGTTLSLMIAMGDIQLGVYSDFPMSNWVQPVMNGRESRMASYGVVLSARM